MPLGTQAEIFIETLADMVAEERARRSAGILRQARLNADRFFDRAFRDDSAGVNADVRHAAVVFKGQSWSA